MIEMLFEVPAEMWVTREAEAIDFLGKDLEVDGFRKGKAPVEVIKKHLPEMADVFDELAPKLYTKEEKTGIEAAYAQCKSISIDYAIMEKADNVYVWLSNFAWSDLGSWASLHELSPKDDHSKASAVTALL